MVARAIGRSVGLLLAGILSACAGGVGLPPIAADPTPAYVALPVDEAGDTVAVHRWAPQGRPRAVIVAAHGYGDHARSTFGAAAPFWAEQGIFVYAYDQRGFGHNPSRGRWPGAEALPADLRAVAAYARREHPNTPLWLVGHSMGGAAALTATAQMAAAEGAPDGVILLAPALWSEDDLPMHLRAPAWLSAQFAPNKRWTGDGMTIARRPATDNAEAVRRLQTDPLYIAAPSSRELYGLIRLMDIARNAAPRAEAPVWVIFGDNDHFVPKRAVRETYQTLPDGRGFLTHPKGWHLLLRDLQSMTVWRQVAALALQENMER